MIKVSNDFILKQINNLSKGHDYRLVKVKSLNNEKYIGTIIEIKKAYYCTFNLGKGNYFIVAYSFNKIIEIISGFSLEIDNVINSKLLFKTDFENNVTLNRAKLFLGENYYVEPQYKQEIIEFDLMQKSGTFSKSDLLKMEIEITFNETNDTYKFIYVINKEIDCDEFVKTNKGLLYIANLKEMNQLEGKNIIQPFNGDFHIDTNQNECIYIYNKIQFYLKSESKIIDPYDVCANYSFLPLVNTTKKSFFENILPYKAKLYIETNQNYDLSNNVNAYLQAYENEKIDNNSVLIESGHGKNISENLKNIANEMKVQNNNLQVYVSLNDINTNIPEGFKAIERLSKEYYLLLATVKYLINDISFPYRFIKRHEQVYVYYWNNVQVEVVGKYKESNPLKINNIQKNLIHSDYVMFTDEVTAQSVMDSYNLRGLVNNKLIVPQPKNEDLYYKYDYDKIRNALNIPRNKKVILWVPRRLNTSQENKINITKHDLFLRMAKISKQLSDEYIIYTNINIDDNQFKEYSNIRKIPKKFITKEIMVASDILLSDYSQLIFEYLHLNKNIILDLTYIEKYQSILNFSIDFEEFEFSKVYSDEQLIYEINNTQNIEYEVEKSKYVHEHSKNASKYIVEKIFSTVDNEIESFERKKVLIYPGGLKNNGITTAFFNLLNQLIKDEKLDIWIYLYYNAVKEFGMDNIIKLNNMGVKFISTTPGLELKKNEQYIYNKVNNKMKLNSFEKHKLKKIIDRQNIKIFGQIKFDHLVNFCGYSNIIALQFSQLNDAYFHTFVHSNMKKELLTRNNFNEYTARKAYKAATNIAVVNQYLMDELKGDFFDEAESDKLKVVQNIIDTNYIIEKSNVHEEYLTPELEMILHDNSIKFISIARFTPEKGTVRLVKAFFEFKNNNNNDAKLFLICSPGSERIKIIEMVDASIFKNDVFIFESVNPFPILKHMSLLIVSSYYEALPMVIFEALTLKVAVASTDIPGPRNFLNQGYGHIVENSTEGIIEAMQKFNDGEIKFTKNDFEEFNNKSLNDFYELINNS